MCLQDPQRPASAGALEDLSVQVINLARATARAEHMQAELAAIGLPMTRCPAVTPDDRQETARHFGLSLAGSPLTALEQACFLSHVRAWRAAARAPGWTLILEDDVIFSADAAEGLALICAESRADLVRIEAFGRARPLMSRHETARAGAFALRRFHGRSIGAAAYLLSPKGAARLLARVRTLPQPVDGLLFLGRPPARLVAEHLLPAIAVQTDQIGALLPRPDAAWQALAETALASQIEETGRTLLSRDEGLRKLGQSLARHLLGRVRLRVPLSSAGPCLHRRSDA